MSKNGQERSNLEMIDEVSVGGVKLLETIQRYQELEYMVEVIPSRKRKREFLTGEEYYKVRYQIKIYKRKDEGI